MNTYLVTRVVQHREVSGWLIKGTHKLSGRYVPVEEWEQFVDSHFFYFNFGRPLERRPVLGEARTLCTIRKPFVWCQELIAYASSKKGRLG